jgi:N-dimethylarginine dimethylaminohydrolase
VLLSPKVEIAERRGYVEMIKLSEEEKRQTISKMKKDPLYREGLPPYTSFDIHFREHLKETWGRDWGGQSSYARLRAVVVQRPGPEAAPKEALADPQWYSLPTGLPNLGKMEQEWDNFVRVLNDNGVETISLNAQQPVLGTYGLPLRCITYCHETLMVKGGAIIQRCAAGFKRGEEYYHSKRLGELGVPILYTVHGKGFFESSNAVWLDKRSIALATSQRTNMDGINQITPILQNHGVDDIFIVHLPGPLYSRGAQVGQGGGSFHLDMIFGVAGPKLAVLYPEHVGYDFVDYLVNRKGFDVIECPLEEANGVATNFLVLEPGKLVMPAGNPVVTGQLRKRGIKVIEVDLSEYAKAGGGPTCMTIPLMRDEEKD